MRKFKAITTMNKSGYEKYGRKMIASWHQYWPHYMELDVYCEDSFFIYLVRLLIKDSSAFEKK